MNRIKEVIKKKGFTIKSLADKLGIARESLSRMIVSPSYPTLEKIATALDVPIWQLFASPEDVAGKEELTALIRFRGQLYQADSIEELENVVKWIREEGER